MHENDTPRIDVYDLNPYSRTVRKHTNAGTPTKSSNRFEGGRLFKKEGVEKGTVTDFNRRLLAP